MLALLIGTALQVAVTSTVTTNWIFRAKDKDPITDLQSASAHVRSTISDARLSVQCDVVGEPIVSVLYIPEQFTGSSGSQRVIFRADADPPIELLSEPISKAKAITDLKQVRRLAHVLARAKSIYVRAFDYSEQPVDARFDVEGGESLIKAVFAACKVPYEAELKKKRG